MSQINQFCYKEVLDKKWLWPSDDKKSWQFLTRGEHLTFPKKISNLLGKKRTVIQAGGHCGLYPYQYSTLFDNVYTFEIDTLNYSCLEENLKNLNNVKIFNIGLGNKQERKGIKRDKKNAGKHMISNNGSDITITTIDEMNIAEVDLIHLDIEGYELFALQGAINTIKHYKPLLVIETNELFLSYKYSLKDIDDWMFSINYEKIIDWPGDRAYKHMPNNKSTAI